MADPKKVEIKIVVNRRKKFSFTSVFLITFPLIATNHSKTASTYTSALSTCRAVRYSGCFVANVTFLMMWRFSISPKSCRP